LRVHIQGNLELIENDTKIHLAKNVASKKDKYRRKNMGSVGINFIEDSKENYYSTSKLTHQRVSQVSNLTMNVNEVNN
jgi:hypothetical protein